MTCPRWKVGLNGSACFIRLSVSSLPVTQTGTAGNVVDRFVGIKLDRLAADSGQRINHMGLDFEQTKFEHLEQGNRAGADDDGIGFSIGPPAAATAWGIAGLTVMSTVRETCQRD